MNNTIYQTVTDQVIKQLESVDPADYQKPWFSVGHSPVNLRGTAYRGINHLLLSHSTHSSNIWGTFLQWKEKECSVRKGERSQMVVLWRFFDKEDKDGTSTGKIGAVMVRYFRVFNADQVTGAHARTVEQRFQEKLLSHDPIAEAQTFVDGYLAAEKMPLRKSDRAYYRNGESEHISMPELGQFHSPGHYYSVFAHEIAHSTGNKNRLDRNLSGKYGSPDYAFEELVAELGSAMLCGSLGLSAKPRIDHAQYIKGWLRALKNDNKFVIQAASKAQKAADYAWQV